MLTNFGAVIVLTRKVGDAKTSDDVEEDPAGLFSMLCCVRAFRNQNLENSVGNLLNSCIAMQFGRGIPLNLGGFRKPCNSGVCRHMYMYNQMFSSYVCTYIYIWYVLICRFVDTSFKARPFPPRDDWWPGVPNPGFGPPSLGLGSPSLGLGTPSPSLGCPILGLGSPSLSLWSSRLSLGTSRGPQP